MAVKANRAQSRSDGAHALLWIVLSVLAASMLLSVLTYLAAVL